MINPDEKLMKLRRGALEFRIPYYMTKYHEGDCKALFKAIDICARLQMPLPQDVGDAFRRHFSKIENYEVNSLDAAFGKPFKKNQHVKPLRDAKKHKWLIRTLVQDIHLKENAPIDESLFARVGRLLHGATLGKTRVSELYYESEAEIKELMKDL